MEPSAHLATLWALAHAGLSQCHCQPWSNELHASCTCAGSAYSRTQEKGGLTFLSILPARAGLGQTHCWVMAKFRGPAGHMHSADKTSNSDMYKSETTMF